MSAAFHRRCQRASRLLFHAGARVHLQGLEHFPVTGSALFVANHISHFDPNLFAMHTPRPIHYMATQELFDLPIAGWLLRGCEAFPINRTKIDRASIRTALQRLTQGHPVGLFPERGIRWGPHSILGGALLSPATASLVALARAPVLPGVIIGSDQLYQWRAWFRRPRIFIAFGPVLHFPENTERGLIGDQITQALRQLYQHLIAEHHITEKELPQSAQERWKEKG